MYIFTYKTFRKFTSFTLLSTYLDPSYKGRTERDKRRLVWHALRMLCTVLAYKITFVRCMHSIGSAHAWQWCEHSVDCRAVPLHKSSRNEPSQNLYCGVKDAMWTEAGSVTVTKHFNNNSNNSFTAPVIGPECVVLTEVTLSTRTDRKCSEQHGGIVGLEWHWPCRIMCVSIRHTKRDMMLAERR